MSLVGDTCTWYDFMKAFSAHYISGALLTIDKQLAPFRGRCTFRQYLLSKPDRYGTKVFWVYPDTEHNFPLLRIPYLGRPAGQERHTNLGRNIPTELATPFFKSRRNVTFDNCFTDMALAETLLKNGWTMVGWPTIKGNKRFLSDSFKSGRQLALYATKFAYNENAAVLKYQSKRRKSVILLSSMYGTSIVGPYPKPKRNQRWSVFYNPKEGAAGPLDKMAHAHTVKCKSQHWPLVMFFNIIDLATIASCRIGTIRFPEHPRSIKDRRSAFVESVSGQLMCAQTKRSMTDVVMP